MLDLDDRHLHYSKLLRRQHTTVPSDDTQLLVHHDRDNKPSKRGSASEECQKVRIDHVGMGGHHAVGEASVNPQRAMLQQLSLQQ